MALVQNRLSFVYSKKRFVSEVLLEKFEWDIVVDFVEAHVCMRSADAS